MYAFNKRFRATTWQGLPFYIWMLFMASFVLLAMALMFGIGSGKVFFGILLCVGSIAALAKAILEIIHMDDHRVKMVIRTGKSDCKKKDFYE